MMIMFYLTGIMVFSLKRNHLLLMLLSLEYMMLFMYFMMYYYMSMNYSYFFCMFFLTFSVCEGALGLTILIMMIRSYGNDNLMSFSSLW